MAGFWSPELYGKAWDFATMAHQGQSYGGKEKGMRIPYINHIGSVAMEILLAAQKTSASLDVDLAVSCALLHDVLEDTKHTYEELLVLFGQSVADGVAALSKDAGLPTKREQMLDSLERIKQQPREIWMVKLADRITNLYHPPFYWDAKRILAYQAEAQIIYDHLSSCDAYLAERLQEKILVYAGFAVGR
ncbi:MAG: bifunctional (p)ppGpp synthetase/guanosine-3',5'-bis(diphosphate) 3'-pyrophosphohydrolase [Myxococcales bacterium]|nr:bifunctional (p)ppGpp synthetase/guanosine-3',5'-bis(diphosphate) 3'-pyrophosphohydrolase [Myxococcales bacterium]